MAFNFGAASTPAFGAATSAFGAPTFGAPAPASFSFAQAAPAASGMFGPPAATPSLFGAATASMPNLFGAAPAQPTLALGAPQSAGLALALPGQQLGQQAQQPITYNTRYDDLQPSLQKELQDIQREISNYRDDIEKLQGDSRLHDAAALKRSMAEETGALKQALQSLANAIQADDDALSDFREKVMQLMRCTESAVRLFQRAKLWREAPQMFKGQLVPPQVQELLAAPIVLPNPYLELAVQGFSDALESYKQVVCDLEAALPPESLQGGQAGREVALGTSLPTIVSYLHDYFVHVAAHMEGVHNEVERSKDQFLMQRQTAGDMTNPFADSRRHHQFASSAKPVVIPPANPAGPANGHGHGPHAQPATNPMPGMFASQQAGFGMAAGAPGMPAANGTADRKQASKGRRK